MATRLNFGKSHPNRSRFHRSSFDPSELRQIGSFDFRIFPINQIRFNRIWLFAYSGVIPTNSKKAERPEGSVGFFWLLGGDRSRSWDQTVTGSTKYQDDVLTLRSRATGPRPNEWLEPTPTRHKEILSCRKTEIVYNIQSARSLEHSLAYIMHLKSGVGSERLVCESGGFV